MDESHRHNDEQQSQTKKEDLLYNSIYVKLKNSHAASVVIEVNDSVYFRGRSNY